MNIQANLPSSNLISGAKKPSAKPAVAAERIEHQRVDNKQISQATATDQSERSKLFDQIESLDKEQALNFRPSALENKQQKSIQSYLDNQALADQDLRDKLHEQLGIDTLA